MIVKATGPEGITIKAVINLEVTPDCTLQIITPVDLENQTYLV